MTEKGKEEFDKQTIENKLKNAGLPEKLAKEVAGRVGGKVEEGARARARWTAESYAENKCRTEKFI